MLGLIASSAAIDGNRRTFLTRGKGKFKNPSQLLDERAFHHEVARRGGVAFVEAALFQHFLDRLEHLRAAAQHGAVHLGVELGHAEVAGHAAAFDQVGDAALVDERLARDRGVVLELLAHHLAQKFVPRQILGDVLVVGQLADQAAAVHQDHLAELLVGFRVADDGHERRQPGAGAEHVQALAGQQVVDQQRAGGLVADDDAVAGLNVLQAAGERAVLHLDAEKLQRFLVVRADDGVGAQQRLAVHAQADHGEVPVGKPQADAARGGERKQAVGPVVNGQDFFFVVSGHGVQGGRSAAASASRSW